MYEWHPGKLPTHMDPDQWRVLLCMFMQNSSSSAIAATTGQNIKQVFKAIAYTRNAMTTDVPAVFSDLVTGLELLRPAFDEQNVSPEFGIIHHKGYIWFDQVENLARPETEPVTGLKFSAFISKNGFEPVDVDGETLQELAAFWESQKHILTGRSGMRPEKFGLYLAESVWRHNHRKQSCTSQIEHLLRIIGAAWHSRNRK